MSSKRSRVLPRYKTKYRVKNWPAYDRALATRGDLTLWITPEAIEAWRPAPCGRPRAENAFFRYKTIIGDRLRAQSEAGRRVAARIACDVLNRMTELGKPLSVAIGA